MQLYNTMTRRKEEFVPQDPKKLGMYACGITAYDYCHIGHARSAVVFDLLARYLRFIGNNVVFVRNFTDVDDKIIARANREGKDSREVAETFIQAFHEDMDRLNVLRADLEPKATEYIEEMQDICRQLIAAGHAYATNSGDVYFRVRSFAPYGKLSGRDIDDLRSGARVAPGEEKEDPLDFALWKAAKPGEPFWESPWGKGRPGWHIECSAMSEKTLSLPLDIHGGGQDLIFPHHENEIAQSEASSGKELARFWVHNGFVQIDSEKMSKSLGNFKTIRDILEQCQPEVLRFFLLGKHYRSPIDFSFVALDEAERGLKRIYESLAAAKAWSQRDSWKSGNFPAEIVQEFNEHVQAFFASLDDDLNGAAAIGHIFSLVRLVNRILEDKKLRVQEEAGRLCLEFLAQARIWGEILGILEREPQEFLLELRESRAKRAGLDMEQVQSLLARRLEARQNKDFAQSDALREELGAMGVEVRDSSEGQSWDIL